jgi:hypothetical protein
MRAHGKKWCPQCGTPRRKQAKVCSNCGYRFKTVPAETAIVPNADPPVTLPPEFDAPAPLPPVSPHPVPLEGEPAPYISNEELNQLRGAGIYNPNLLARTITRLTRKDKR